MKAPTIQQLKIMKFIEDFKAKEKRNPSNREVAEYFDVSSEWIRQQLNWIKKKI